MSDRIMKNRIRLASLIYSMGTFTEKDLINRYYEDVKFTFEGDHQSILEFLLDLRQFGTLRYDDGKYTVAGLGENRYA